jgi:hypothetical protein
LNLITVRYLLQAVLILLPILIRRHLWPDMRDIHKLREALHVVSRGMQSVGMLEETEAVLLALLQVKYIVPAKVDMLSLWMDPFHIPLHPRSSNVGAREKLARLYLSTGNFKDAIKVLVSSTDVPAAASALIRIFAHYEMGDVEVSTGMVRRAMRHSVQQM